jgi:phosphohistidine phosphatase
MTLNNKNIILMRHADSLDALRALDIDRELSDRGIMQAEEAVIFLAKFNIDKVLVSPAVRTMQTLDILKHKLNIKNIEVVEELYRESEDKILEIISKQLTHTDNLMIIGHNPSICATAFALSKTTDKNYDYLMQILMPPATIVVVSMLEAQTFQEVQARHLGSISDIFVPTHE